MKKYNIVYKITNLLNNYIYIGAHSTNNINDKYMSSSKYVKQDIKDFGKEYFTKEILFIFDNKEDMLTKEKELVNKEFCFRNDTYNRIIGGSSGSFSYIGMTTVIDNKNNIMKVYLDDPRYLSGELVHNMTDMINVKDKDGNRLTVHRTDTRYISGEFISIHKGRKGIKGMLGKTLTDEQKQHLSSLAKLRVGEKSSGYGKKFINNGIINKRVSELELNNYLNSGWILGMLKRK